jgi:hypothetical protein
MKVVVENTLQFATQLCDSSSREIKRKQLQRKVFGKRFNFRLFFGGFPPEEET